MIVFVYEFATGGGLLGLADSDIQSSLAREGAAMMTALATDFAALPETEVCLLQDYRCGLPQHFAGDIIPVATAEEHDATFDRLAAQADRTVVIAPEIGGRLSSCCRRVQQVGGRLIGPSTEITDLAGDKQATAEHLAAAGVPVPLGMALDAATKPPIDFRFPAVIKPRDGAGSLGIKWVASREELDRIVRETGKTLRLESFCPGTPVSVACLCGPDICVPLEPSRQLLSDDGCFQYLGGSLPLPRNMARRAVRLAVRAIQCLKSPLGYLGVDLVLGDDPAGRDDVVIEINPRLTTSYVGLRAATTANLAAAMLAAADGTAPSLSFSDVPLRFDPDGTVSRNPHGAMVESMIQMEPTS